MSVNTVYKDIGVKFGPINRLRVVKNVTYFLLKIASSWQCLHLNIWL